MVESLFNKVAGLSISLQLYQKKRLQHRGFPVKFTNFLRTSILKNICERLLLDHILTSDVFRTLSNSLTELFKNGQTRKAAIFSKSSITDN